MLRLNAGLANTIVCKSVAQPQTNEFANKQNGEITCEGLLSPLILALEDPRSTRRDYNNVLGANHHDDEEESDDREDDDDDNDYDESEDSSESMPMSSSGSSSEYEEEEEEDISVWAASQSHLCPSDSFGFGRSSLPTACDNEIEDIIQKVTVNTEREVEEEVKEEAEAEVKEEVEEEIEKVFARMDVGERIGIEVVVEEEPIMEEVIVVSTKEEEEECPVCFETFSNPCTLFCGHRYCRDCLTQYLSTKITEREADLKCPNTSCGRLIEIEIIESLVREELIHQYVKYKLEMEIARDPNCRYCPNPKGCDAIIICDPSNKKGTTVTCVKCSYKFCFHCKQKKHRGVCYANVSEVEKRTRNWKKTHGVKTCPSCAAEYYRFNGCPRMYCSNCGLYFSDNTGRKLSGDQGEGLIEASLRLPQQLYWASRDFGERLSRKKPGQSTGSRYLKATGVLCLEYLILLVIGLPIYVVAAPPTYISRTVKLLKPEKLSKKQRDEHNIWLNH